MLIPAFASNRQGALRGFISRKTSCFSFMGLLVRVRSHMIRLSCTRLALRCAGWSARDEFHCRMQARNGLNRMR
jgi:hypothetical protein